MRKKNNCQAMHYLFFSMIPSYRKIIFSSVFSVLAVGDKQAATTVSNRLHYIKKENCTPSPHYPTGSVISYLCSADLSHTKKGYLWNLIAEVCRFMCTYSLRHASGWPALWSVASAWIWGMRWLMFSIDECWSRHSAKFVRKAAAGLDMTNSNLFPAGVETTWGLQVLVQDGAPFCYIMSGALSTSVQCGHVTEA